MQFLDKKHVVDTEDSIVESQNTINESQPNSEIGTNDNAHSTLPSTSEGSNFCKPKKKLLLLNRKMCKQGVKEFVTKTETLREK